MKTLNEIRNALAVITDSKDSRDMRKFCSCSLDEGVVKDVASFARFWEMLPETDHLKILWHGNHFSVTYYKEENHGKKISGDLAIVWYRANEEKIVWAVIPMGHFNDLINHRTGFIKKGE